MKLEAATRLKATEDTLKKLITGKSASELQELAAKISAAARTALLGKDAES